MADDVREEEDEEKMKQAFARALRRRLTFLNISRSELARRLDVHPTAVGYWASAQREPSPRTVFRIEQELGSEPGSLSQHLGYRPARRLIVRRPMTVIEAIRADEELDPEAQSRLIDHYGWLKHFTRTQMEAVVSQMTQVINESGVTTDQDTKDLMARLEESLARVKAERAAAERKEAERQADERPVIVRRVPRRPPPSTGET